MGFESFGWGLRVLDGVREASKAASTIYQA